MVGSPYGRWCILCERNGPYQVYDDSFGDEVVSLHWFPTPASHKLIVLDCAPEATWEQANKAAQEAAQYEKLHNELQFDEFLLIRVAEQPLAIF